MKNSSRRSRASSAANRCDGGVRAFAEVVTIPTFAMSRGIPTPVLFELEETRSAYPRAVFDVGTRAKKPVKRKYTILVIESDLLRVEVAPEIGGHVWRMIDKRSGRNLLWTNDCVKPVDAGRRRGYVVGGIEFPFPVSNHGEDTIEPYRWAMRRSAGGAATITVSSFDHFYRFWGSYDVTIKPGDLRVAITVRLHNPTPVRNRYQIWVNGAVPAGADAQFIFPVDYIAGHGFSGIHPWPMWDDGKLDRSFWKNQKEQLGVFGWNSDFLGVYYHKRDCGTLRWCDHTRAEGIKAWTWGAGTRWTGEYTMRRGHSVEIQWGRWANQDMYGWLEPHETCAWTEYWFPVHGLGGVDEASRDAAMSVKIARSGRRPVSAGVRINVLEAVRGTLTVAIDGKTILSKEVNAALGDTFEERVPLKGVRENTLLSVALADDRGRVVIRYDKPINRRPGPPPKEPKSVRVDGAGPVWEKFESALSRELLDGSLSRAREEYETLINANPGFAPAWKALGILLYKQCDLEAANRALSKAAELTPADAEARYYLGLAGLELGGAASIETLESVRGDSRFERLAKFLIAREALKSGDYRRALGILSEVVSAEAKDMVAWDLVAVAARLAGDAGTATKALDAALAAEPLDAYAMTEKLVASGKLSAGAIEDALGADADLYMEVALFYDSINQPQTALEVARAAQDRATSALDCYYLAYFASRVGDDVLARTYAAGGDEMGTDYAFPHRREDLAILDAVSKLAPHPAYAQYHRATLLYWLGRNEDALEIWTGLLERYDVPGLARTVADACGRGKVSVALDAATNLYRRALAENPKDPRVYHALDDLYEKSANIHDRRDLLERGHKLFPADDELAIRLARYLANRAWYDKAARILQTHKFRRTHQSRQLVWMAQRAIETAYTGLAAQALRSGAKTKALKHLKTASEAPETIKKWFD